MHGLTWLFYGPFGLENTNFPEIYNYNKKLMQKCYNLDRVHQSNI